MIDVSIGAADRQRRAERQRLAGVHLHQVDFLLDRPESLDCAVFQFCLALEATVQLAGDLLRSNGIELASSDPANKIVHELCWLPGFDPRLQKRLRQLVQWRNRAVHRYGATQQDPRWWSVEAPDSVASLAEDLRERGEELSIVLAWLRERF